MIYKNILISVSNKSGLLNLIENILLYSNEEKINMIASQGTYKYIKESFLLDKHNNVDLQSIESYINSDEILDGRVKTLHPKIYAGILFDRKNKQHIDWFEKKNILDIHLVIVNLYPFENLLNKDIKNLTITQCINQIDIGGVSLLRAAAKNFPYVTVLGDTKLYIQFIDKFKKQELTLKMRYDLAIKTFKMVSDYDKNIAEFFEKNQSFF